MDNWFKSREKLLEKDKRTDFLVKREHQTKRFGKQRIFNLFKQAYDKLNGDNSQEKFALVIGWIVNELKKQENIWYLKTRNTHKELASLFGKFKYSMDQCGDRIFDVCGGNLNNVESVNLNNIWWNESIQLSLFDNLTKNPQEINEKTIADNNIKDDTIDIDELYKHDPDEHYWHK